MDRPWPMSFPTMTYENIRELADCADGVKTRTRLVFPLSPEGDQANEGQQSRSLNNLGVNRLAGDR